MTNKPKSRAPTAKTRVAVQPIQERAEDSVRCILEAVARLQAKDGPDGVTTRKVAAVAGVGIGTVYRYFPDRAALMHAAEMRAWQAELQHLMAKVPELWSTSMLESIRNVVGYCVERVGYRMQHERFTLADPDMRAAALASSGVFARRIASIIAPAASQLRIDSLEKDLELVIVTVCSTIWALSHPGCEAISLSTFKPWIAEMVIRMMMPDQTVAAQIASDEKHASTAHANSGHPAATAAPESQPAFLVS